MKTTRIRHLVAGGVLTAAAVLGAPTALAQPVPCTTDPANPGNETCASPDSMYGPISDPNPDGDGPPGTLPGPLHDLPPGMPGSPIP